MPSKPPFRCSVHDLCSGFKMSLLQGNIYAVGLSARPAMTLFVTVMHGAKGWSTK